MIRIQYNNLDSWISKLRGLTQSDHLPAMSISNSKGEVAAALLNTRADVCEINDHLNTLINSTADFLKNIGASFQETDMNVADSFRKG